MFNRLTIIFALALTIISCLSCGQSQETNANATQSTVAQNGYTVSISEENYTNPEDEIKFSKNGLAAVNFEDFDLGFGRTGDVFYYNGHFYHNRGYGFINQNKECVIPPVYNYLSNFSDNGLALAGIYSIKTKYGYINENGEWVIKPQFDVAAPFSESGVAIVCFDHSYHLIDESGAFIKELTGIKHPTRLFDFGDSDIIPALTKGGYGFDETKYRYINKDGEFVTDLEFDVATSFSPNGLALVKIGGKYGYINEKVEYIIEPQFENAKTFKDNGLAGVCIDGKWGFINEKNEFIIDPKFDDIYYGENSDLIGVQVGNKYGAIDKNGKIVIDIIYNSLSLEEKDWAQVSLTYESGDYTYINTSGESKTYEEYYQYISNLYNKDNILYDHDAKLYQVIDENGNVIYESSALFSYINETRVYVDGKYGIINKQNEYILPPIYDSISFDHYDYLMGEVMLAKKDGKYGIIDTLENILIPFEYDKIEEYDYIDFNGYFVTSNGKVGFYDAEFNLIAEPIYDDINKFEPIFSLNHPFYGKYLTELDGKYGLFSLDGIIAEPIYDSISIFNNNHYFDYFLLIEKDGKYGAISPDGTIIEAIYDEIVEYGNNSASSLYYIKMKKDGKYGLYVSEKINWEPIYDFIHFYEIVSTEENVDPTYCVVIELNGECGILALDGSVILEQKYEKIKYCSENNLFKIFNDGKCGLFSLEKGVLIEPKYDDIDDYSIDESGHLETKLDGLYGKIDINGNVILDPIYDALGSFTDNGFCRASRPNEAWGYVNIYGEWLIEEQFYSAGDFSEGLAYALRRPSSDSHYGYIDETGKYVIDDVFDDAKDFSGGIAAVKKDGVWGYIDTLGAYIVLPQFAEANDFIAEDGYAIAVKADGDYKVFPNGTIEKITQ